MKKYTTKNLPTILRMMADYCEECESENESTEYFNEIAKTGLFHDAIGKITEVKDGVVSVTEDY